MWHTSRGDRTLRGAESELIGAAIDSMVDELLIHLDDCFEEDLPQRGHYGLVAYDSLTISQRVGLLHDVARHLLTDTSSVFPLSASAEAAVAALFIEVHDSVTIEIDLSIDADADSRQQLQQWRRLVMRAAQDTLVDLTEIDSNDFDQRNADQSSQIEIPEASCADKSRWSDLIDLLAEAILWDRDFELADSFLDADPGESSQRRRLLGIEDDYFTRVAPDPRPEELEGLVFSTRDIARAKPK